MCVTVGCVCVFQRGGVTTSRLQLTPGPRSRQKASGVQVTLVIKRKSLEVRQLRGSEGPRRDGSPYHNSKQCYPLMPDSAISETTTLSSQRLLGFQEVPLSSLSAAKASGWWRLQIWDPADHTPAGAIRSPSASPHPSHQSEAPLLLQPLRTKS